MRNAWVLLGLAAVSACFPQRHALSGRACDDAHPCPDALQCVALVCLDSTPADAGDAGVVDAGSDGGGARADAGDDAGTDAGPAPPNLLPSGDFEGSLLDVLAEFRPPAGASLDVQVAHVHRGIAAGQLKSLSALGLSFETQPGALTSVPAGTYCATAWVSGDGDGSVTLSLRSTSFGNPAEVVSTPLPTSTQTLAPEWKRLVAKMPIDADTISFALELSASVPAGQLLFLDDIVLWRSASQTCGFE